MRHANPGLGQSLNLGMLKQAMVFIPFARGRAATRAVLWTVPAFLLGAACVLIYGRLTFARTAISNAIVDYAIGLATLPLIALAFLCGFRAIRYLAAVIWPAKLGVLASDGRLELCLGPFGHVVYPVEELDIRYPFELIDDPEEGGFEQFVPEEEQIERMIPRIKHATEKEPINRTILRFMAGEEKDIAVALRPAIELWRKQA